MVKALLLFLWNDCNSYSAFSIPVCTFPDWFFESCTSVLLSSFPYALPKKSLPKIIYYIRSKQMEETRLNSAPHQSFRKPLTFFTKPAFSHICSTNKTSNRKMLLKLRLDFSRSWECRFRHKFYSTWIFYIFVFF